MTVKQEDNCKKKAKTQNDHDKRNPEGGVKCGLFAVQSLSEVNPPCKTETLCFQLGRIMWRNKARDVNNPKADENRWRDSQYGQEQNNSFHVLSI